MRLIKLAILSFIVLFLVVTAISLLIPSHIRISRATNVAPRQDSIFALIKDTPRWHQWFPPFIQNDSGQKIPPIKIYPRSISDSELVYQLQQENKNPITTGWKIYHHASTDSLTLQWYMDFHLTWYPWQKFGSLLYESTYGAMMEKGLINIKTLTNK